MFCFILWFFSLVYSEKVLLASVPSSKSHAYQLTRVASELHRRGHEIVYVINEDDAKYLQLQDFDVLTYSRSYTTDEVNEVYSSERMLDTLTFIEVFYDYLYRNGKHMMNLYDELKDMNIDYAVIDLFAYYTHILVDRLDIPYIFHDPAGIAMMIPLVQPVVELSQTPILASASKCSYPLGFTDALVNYFMQVLNVIVVKNLASLQKLNEVRTSFGLHSPEHFMARSQMVLYQSPPFYRWPSVSEIFDSRDDIRFTGPILPHVANPLNETFQAIMDASKKVIYFSLGTIVTATKSAEKRAGLQSLFNALGSLKEFTVLHKIVDRALKLPNNFKAFKYLPQNDLLAHPKLELFITHGGFNSVMESLYHGVPMLVLPSFADQPVHALKIEFLAKTGRSISMGMSEEEILYVINNVLSDDLMKERAAALSKELNRLEPLKNIGDAIEEVFNGDYVRMVDPKTIQWQNDMLSLLSSETRVKFYGIPFAFVNFLVLASIISCMIAVCAYCAMPFFIHQKVKEE